MSSNKKQRETTYIEDDEEPGLKPRPKRPKLSTRQPARTSHTHLDGPYGENTSKPSSSCSKRHSSYFSTSSSREQHSPAISQSRDGDSGGSEDSGSLTGTRFRLSSKSGSGRTVTDELVPKMKRAAVAIKDENSVHRRTGHHHSPRTSDLTVAQRMVLDSDEDGECMGDFGVWLDSEIASKDDEKPVRSLDGFAVQGEADEYIGFMQLLECPNLRESGVYATGTTKPILTKGQHASNYKGRLIRLTNIKEVNMHHYEGGGKFNPDIYLETENAFYILKEPSDQYLTCCLGFLFKHRALDWTLKKAVNTPHLSYEAYMKDLFPFRAKPKDSVITVTALPRRLNRDEYFESIEEYILCSFAVYWEQQGPDTTLPRFFQDMTAKFSGAGEPEEPQEDPDCGYDLGGPVASRNLSGFLDCNGDHKTFVTPMVYTIARHMDSTLFNNRLQCISEPLRNLRFLDSDDTFIPDHGHNPRDIKTSKVKVHLSDGSKLYHWVELDGVRYEAGQFVAMQPGKDVDEDRQSNDAAPDSQSSNNSVNNVWLGQIMTIYMPGPQSEQDLMFHHTWLVHGSKTVLKEAAHARELYQLDSECESNPVSSILHRINVERIDRETPLLDMNLLPKNSFYVRFVWNEKELSFTEIPELEGILALASETERLALEMDTIDRGWNAGHGLLMDVETREYILGCYACNYRHLLEYRYRGTVRDNFNAFDFAGTRFHCKDFVFLRQGRGKPHKAKALDDSAFSSNISAPDVLDIGQILVIKQSKTKDEMGLTLEIERHLRYTSSIKSYSIGDVDGLVFVRYFSLDDEDNEENVEEQIASWTRQSEEHFYVDYFSDYWMCCEVCLHAEEAKIEAAQNIAPLRSLELFSGAGGLCAGLEMSGATETVCAVDIDESSVKSFKANHPETMVFAADVNEYIAAYYETENGPPMLQGKEIPEKGYIQLIAGGPPCQSFSQINTTKKEDDIRSTLSCSLLSSVEILRPDYVIIENVAGFLHYGLSRKQAPQIEYGMIKFIYATLLALGYQVRYTVPNALQFGSPQSRSRIIILASRANIPLPKTPRPTHTLPACRWYASPMRNHQLPPPSRSLVKDADWKSIAVEQTNHTEAPHAFVTIDQAIGDLPAWDWRTPEERPEETRARRERRRENIRAFDAVSRGRRDGVVGHMHGVEYAHAPTNRYQEWLREGSPEMVFDHVTEQYRHAVVERVMYVPLEPGASSKGEPNEYMFVAHSHRPMLHGQIYLSGFKTGFPLKQGNSTRVKVSKGTNAMRRWYILRTDLTALGIAFYGRCGGDSYCRTLLTDSVPGKGGSKKLHPHQKRIYSVRESARMQGFPDNFVFKSIADDPARHYSEVARQIGNAVPIPLAIALGRTLIEAELEREAVEAKRVRAMSIEI